MSQLQNLKNDLKALGNPEKARHSIRFFKTGKGEYAEGDIFLGITVPEQRRVAKRYEDLPLQEIEKLLQEPIHEYRLTALIVLVNAYNHGKSNKQRKSIVDVYIDNRKYINNWDLVDLSAHHILGAYLVDKDRKLLYDLAKSGNLWDQRIAIISTYYFIRNEEYEDTLKIAEILLNHEHDLIHKAVGWMLREVGKRNQIVEEIFLKVNYKKMPRTMLRYAIERFDESLRQKYLKGEI